MEAEWKDRLASLRAAAGSSGITLAATAAKTVSTPLPSDLEGSVGPVPFSPARYESLIGKVEASLSADRRLDGLEKAFKASSDAQALLERRLCATQEKLEFLQAKVLEEETVREAQNSSMREMIAAAQLRIDTAESAIDGTTSRHSSAFEELRISHARLADDRETRDAQHSSTLARIKSAESSIAELAHRHGLTEQRLETWRHQSEVRIDEEQTTRSSSCRKLSDRIAQESEEREKLQSLVREQLEQAERLSASHAEKLAMELEMVKATHAKMLALEAEARESHQSFVAERFSYFDATLGDSTEKHDQHALELAAMSERLEQLRGRLSEEALQRAAEHCDVCDRIAGERLVLNAKFEEVQGRISKCEELSPVVANLRVTCAGLADDKASLFEQYAPLEGRLHYLETHLAGVVEKQSREVASALSRLDQLHNQFSEERLRREEFHDSEREARDGHHTTIQERLERLQGLVQEVAARPEGPLSELRAQQGVLKERLSSFERGVGEKVAGVLARVEGEQAQRREQFETAMDQVESERRARDALEGQVQHHIQAQQEVLQGEKVSRERHWESMRELLGREREERERCDEAVLGRLVNEHSAREAAHREVQDAISQERVAREEQHNLSQEFLQKEKAARRALEDQLAQECHERERYHGVVVEHVEAVQQSVRMFDTLIRTEVEERSGEARRLWAALNDSGVASKARARSPTSLALLGNGQPQSLTAPPLALQMPQTQVPSAPAVPTATAGRESRENLPPPTLAVPGRNGAVSPMTRSPGIHRQLAWAPAAFASGSAAASRSSFPVRS